MKISDDSRCFDISLAVFIFVLVSIGSGRIYRFPFDDEVFTLKLISDLRIGELARYLLNGNDTKPPLSYLLFSSALMVGTPLVALRWISIACTAGALAIWHWLTLSSLDEPVPDSMRLLIALLFGLTPMAVSQGDALRWYPLFTLTVAVTFLIYLRSSHRWFLSAITLGLSADTCFLAILPLSALLVHRYVIERKFRWSEDLRFFLIGGVVGSPGAVTFINILHGGWPSDEFTPGILRRIFDTSLGFFGAVTLGLSQAWIVVIATVATVYLARSALGTPIRSSANRLCVLVLVTASAAAIFTMVGLSKPRAYLYLTPMFSALTAIGLMQAIRSAPRLGAAAYATLIVASTCVLSNLRASDTPFKRNSVIPFSNVVDFVKTNQRGKTVLLTSDPTVFYSLANAPDICTAEFEWWSSHWNYAACVPSKQNDTVIVVKGAPLNESDPQWTNAVSKITGVKKVVAEAHFGRDDDAHLKARLTGVPLPINILHGIIYR